MRVFFFVAGIFFSVGTYAQKYKSYESTVSFFSEATLEDIAAENRKGPVYLIQNQETLSFLFPLLLLNLKIPDEGAF